MLSRSEDNCGSRFSPSAPWVLGTELRFSDMVKSSFPFEPPCQPSPLSSRRNLSSSWRSPSYFDILFLFFGLTEFNFACMSRSGGSLQEQDTVTAAEGSSSLSQDSRKLLLGNQPLLAPSQEPRRINLLLYKAALMSQSPSLNNRLADRLALWFLAFFTPDLSEGTYTPQ